MTLDPEPGGSRGASRAPEPSDRLRIRLREIWTKFRGASAGAALGAVRRHLGSATPDLRRVFSVAKITLAAKLTNAASRLTQVWPAIIDQTRSAIGSIEWTEFEKWGRRAWPAPIIISIFILAIGAYNLYLAINTTRGNRPNLVITDATLYINPAGMPPDELVQISLHNIGSRAARRGSATVFTLSEDGNRYVKFGFVVITTGLSSMDTTLGAFIGGGFSQIPIDMDKFLGLFLICIKYHDDHGTSYKESFVFDRGVKLNETQSRLDELPSKHFFCPR